LRVHHWVKLAQPIVSVLTDGSGRSGQSRLHATTEILNEAGARRGTIYGRWTDSNVYDAIRSGAAGEFSAIAQILAQDLIANEIDTIVADAAEGYNPSHDICRYLVDAVIEFIHMKTGRELRSFEFTLVGRPDVCPENLRADAIRVDLDDSAIARKIAAARGYSELQSEVEAAVAKFGERVFATEYLLPADAAASLARFREAPPYYETYGEQQVAAGHYPEAIRFREHVEPLVYALREELGIATLEDARVHA
jgi:hypothetical protein